MNDLSLRGKVVAVTGGAGFIGSHLCDRIIRKNPKKLVIVDNFSLGKMRNLSQLRHDSRVKVVAQDASNYEAMSRVMRRDKVKIVFNLAVLPLPRSLEEPKVTVDQNVLITTTLCELARLGDFQTLIHCSSSEAYGTALYVPMDEEHPENPLTPYAASKIACDNIVMSYYRTFGIDTAIARLFNTYGPRQNEGTYAAVIPLTIRRILSGGQPLLHGDGLQTRDYSYVEDIADALTQFYQSEATRGKVINIASGREVRIGEIVKMIARLLRYKGRIEHDEPRPGDVRRHKGDISQAKKLIGYAPRTDFKTGLMKTVEWYRSNPS